MHVKIQFHSQNGLKLKDTDKKLENNLLKKKRKQKVLPIANVTIY